MNSPAPPARWHSRIAATVAIVGGLYGLLVMMDFGSINQGTDWNAVFVIGAVLIGAMTFLVMVSRHLDRAHPTNRFGDAVVRLLAPVLVLIVGSAWLMNQGIFARSDNAFIGTWVIVAVLVGLTWFVLSKLAPATGSEPAIQASPTQLPTATTVLDGPPQWPSAPPTGSPAPTLAALPANTAPLAPSSAPDEGRSIAHRVTSGIITLGWIPLGALVWFAANWCPNEGTGDAVFATSTIYVIAQLAGNALAGWLLDRHYGSRGGTMLAIGRSVLVAVLLIVVFAVGLNLFIPDGASRYCG